MALLPYLFDDILPRRRTTSLLPFHDEEDILSLIDRPMLVRRRDYQRPWLRLAAAVKDLGSTIKADKDKFQVNLDVQHFSPEEISVKTADGYILIEGKHEEKEDDHGYVSRQFTRRYKIPDDCSPETIESKLSSDGVLSIVAPRCSSDKNERAIPITHTGPVRRKQVEEDQHNMIENGEELEEEKAPQKKRRR